MPNPLADIEEIRRAIPLFLEPGEIAELRAPKTERDGTISGYFSDAEKLARAAASISGKAPGIYITLNRLPADVLARAENRIKSRAQTTTSDAEITRRLWLLLDFDPRRPAGISSTREEHAAALDAAQSAADHLARQGWPAPVVGDSGNGGHLLYRIDLPNDQESADLVRAVLVGADQRYSLSGVTVDLSVFNAARISKLYGTVARKGDSTEDRPHRLSRILRRPDVLDVVSVEQLRAIASTKSSAAPRTPAAAEFNLERWIIEHGVEIERGPVQHQGAEKWILKHCPFNPDHAAPDSALFRQPSGRIGFKCLHASCADKDWKEVREHFEPRHHRHRPAGARGHAAAASSASVADHAGDPTWKRSLLRNSRGEVRPVLANAILALSSAPEWAGLLAFNDFAVRVHARRAAPWGKSAGEAWSDNDDRRTAEWLQHQGIFVATSLAGEAVQTVAMMTRFHPVRDYLRSLVWDRTKRLDRWCERYLGSSKPIANRFGRLWAISAVARILKPGSKCDCALVLEARQGAGKSTAARSLAGEYFTDQLSDLGSKDAAMQCHGVWIVELAELDSVNRAESSRIKGFMSQTFDRIRLPYGKNISEWPRDCVFIGSVNHDAYLRDETGARRFWPIRCGQIDNRALALDRDQLWAEAVAQFDAGATWWLQDDESIRQAEAEQSERYQSGAWDGVISEWLRNPSERMNSLGHPVAEFSSTEESVTVEDILHHAIGRERKLWTRADSMSVAAALKSLGWERYRQRVGNNSLQWRYRQAK
jgi:predicted P-loop ATPase